MAYPTFDPEWATQDTIFPDGTDNKVRPTSNLREFGYTPDSFPTAQELNWMLNNFYQQITELKAQVANPSQIPVGMVVEIHNNSANPSNIFGYGTWTPFAQGRITVGAGTGTDANGLQQAFNAGATGGEYSHKLTPSELPEHTHSISMRDDVDGTSGNNVASTGTSGFTGATVTGAAGGNQAHNNVQPYIVVYKWVRVS